MTTAEVIRDNYLKMSRPRSEAFQTGLFYVLQRRLGPTPQLIECPFRLGTADADAWFAGCADGVEAWERRAEYLS